MGMPLHYAAEQGNADVVQLLIEAGANVNALDASGITPFRLAKNHNHEDVVRLLGGKSGSGSDPLYKWAMFVSVLFIIIVLILLASR